MWNKISYVRKVRLLVPAGILVLLLCWIFAFSKTYDAIQLNRQTSLSNADSDPADLSYNEAYNQRKLKALDGIIKSYQTGKAVQGNELWLRVSGIASSLKVSVEYTSAPPALSIDTNAIGVNQTLFFYGKYIPLVRLIDSIERTPGIGKITGLQIQSLDRARSGERFGERSGEPSPGENSPCKLKLILKSLPKN